MGIVSMHVRYMYTCVLYTNIIAYEYVFHVCMYIVCVDKYCGNMLYIHVFFMLYDECILCMHIYSV